MRRAHLVLLGAICCLAVGCGLAREVRTARAKMRTPTTVPSPTPIPGFTRIAGTAIEIWLPDTYRGGDPAIMGQDLAAALRQLGDADAMDRVRTLAAHWRLMAVDVEPGPTGVVPTVVIASLYISEGDNVNTYARAFARAWPETYELVSSKRADVAGHEGRRMEFASDQAGVAQLVYVLRRGDRGWVVVFTASQDNYDDMRPVFEQSIETFRVIG